MNPRVDLQEALGALVQSSKLISTAQQLTDVLGAVDERQLRENLESLECSLEEARGYLDDAVLNAKAWELTPGPDEPAWACQARRIADAVDDAHWAVRGIVFLWSPDAREEPVGRLPGGLKALADSLDLCVARLAAVLLEVRRG